MKIGVIGAGFIGAVHLEAYANIPEAEVVGVADTRPEVAAAGASKVGAKPYGSYEELVAAEAPDLIDICLPTPFHRDLAVRAAGEGRHVIVEKPIARRPEDAKAIVEAFSNSRGRLFVGHVVRFFPEYVRLKEMVDEGRFGQVGIVRTSRKSPFLDGWTDWYANWQASGGTIVDLLIHDFDFLRWCFGDVARVYAKSMLGREYNRLDYTLVTLRFASGVIAHVEGHWGYPNPFWYSVEIAGTEALATVDSRKQSSFELLVDRHAGGPVGEVPGDSLGVNPYQKQLEHFVRCARRGEQPVVRGEDAYEALRISAAAMLSARTGEPVVLKGV